MAKDDPDKCTQAYRNSAAFKRASFHTPDEIWSMFVDTEGFTDVVFTFRALLDALNLSHPGAEDGHDVEMLYGISFYEALRSKLTSWKCQSLWDLLNARLKCSGLLFFFSVLVYILMFSLVLLTHFKLQNELSSY